MRSAPIHNFRGNTAIVLVRSPEIGARIKDRCDRLGVKSHVRSTDLDSDTAAIADILVIDIDTADDAMLPWPRGAAPVPVIGLIGSESPGRLAWALAQEIDAFLPVAGLGNLFSAMVIAHEIFARKADRAARDAEQARRRGGRLDVIRAVLSLMQDGRDEALALKQLRAMAMVEQISLEEAAVKLLHDRGLAGGKRA
ncbi:ANTAR domain-containing response regulator [Meridianimarinicoccus sp. RP-17]|uniref:transcriptional antiterminator n=1 Tax=Meridianimarinicoccus zhengii TaxID=2056810 RepID=UPI000DACDDB6|nr:transcriptional antiterminator [Phycocomes zhengii]